MTPTETSTKRCIFDDGSARGAKKTLTTDATIKAFLDEQGVQKITSKVRTFSGPWKSPEVVLAIRRTNDDLRGTQGIEVGGSVAGGEPVYVIRIDLGPHPEWKARPSVRPGPPPKDPVKADAEWRRQYHLFPAVAAVVDVSPDGKDLGVVAFAEGTESVEEAAIVRMPVETFAARVRK